MNSPDLTNQQVQLKKIEEQTLDLLQFDSGNPKDLFEFYHPQLRKQYIDGYNLARCWLQNLLYWKKLYPENSFHTKSAYGKEVHVACSELVRNYLDNFFDSFSQNIQNISYLQINIFQVSPDGTQVLKEIQRCQLKFPEQDKQYLKFKDQNLLKEKAANSQQRQMEFKLFLSKSEESFKKGFIATGQAVTFKLGIGYCWKEQYKKSEHKFHLLEKYSISDKQSSSLSDVIMAKVNGLQLRHNKVQIVV